MEMFYANDGIQNYLNVDIGFRRDVEASGNYYKIKMLESNIIPNVINPICVELNGEIILRYNISGGYVLSRLLLSLKPDGEVTRIILNSILESIEALDEYLLVADDLIINPDYLIYDSQNMRIGLIYAPGYNIPVMVQIRELVEYFMKNFDYRDKAGVDYLYGSYEYFLGNRSDLYSDSKFCNSVRCLESTKMADAGNVYVDCNESLNDAEYVYEHYKDNRQANYRNIQKEMSECNSENEEGQISSHFYLVIIVSIMLGIAVFMAAKYIIYDRKIYDIYISLGVAFGAVIITAFFLYFKSHHCN